MASAPWRQGALVRLIKRVADAPRNRLLRLSLIEGRGQRGRKSCPARTSVSPLDAIPRASCASRLLYQSFAKLPLCTLQSHPRSKDKSARTPRVAASFPANAGFSGNTKYAASSGRKLPLAGICGTVFFAGPAGQDAPAAITVCIVMAISSQFEVLTLPLRCPLRKCRDCIGSMQPGRRCRGMMCISHGFHSPTAFEPAAAE